MPFKGTTRRDDAPQGAAAAGPGTECGRLRHGRSSAGRADRSQIKARLVGEKSANLTRVGVLSTKGAVYLSGAVESAEARARAATLAQGVPGVTRVVNTLDVRPAL